MFISPSMLDRIYVRGSLKNTDAGYEFKLKNNIDNGTLSGVKSLVVDGADVAVTEISLKTTAGERRADEITYRNPLPLYYNSEAAVRVTGQPLADGAHSLVLSINVYEVGTLQVKISDEIL
jgi:hypothetical protein